MKSKIAVFLFILLPALKINAQSKAYLKEEADGYYKAGRYWDSFFLYRDIAKVPEFQGNVEVENQIKNSSHAMYLWKKTEDYRAFRKYEIAKSHLTELLVINPYDPNKGLLPRLSMEEAAEYQRLAYNQTTKEATNASLKKALDLYNLALQEGLKDDMVFSLIKQCEFSLEKNKYSEIKQPTSYGLNYEKKKEIERIRTVEILKEGELIGH